MTDKPHRPGLVHVVDDEESMRRSLTFALQGAGYRVERWASGESFLQGVDSEAPAVVLLDLRMAGMDGLETQAAMVDQGLDFPVVLMTGHGDVGLAVRAMKAGALDFLVKPFDLDRLLETVRDGERLLGNTRDLREREARAERLLNVLTPREREVLDGLACGMPNKTIAHDLGISARTVEVYRANAMVKLDVRTFADALRIAFAAGLGSDARWRQVHGLGSQPRLPGLT